MRRLHATRQALACPGRLPAALSRTSIRTGPPTMSWSNCVSGLFGRPSVMSPAWPLASFGHRLSELGLQLLSLIEGVAAQQPVRH
jgi:hypothetical protein